MGFRPGDPEHEIYRQLGIYQAAGVRLANGEMYQCRPHRSAADGYSTLYDLLEGRYLTPELKKLHAEWPLFKPTVLINFGVAREFAQDPSIIMLKPKAKITAGYLDSDCWVIRIFNYCPDCAPAGKTVLQVMIESQWQPWKESVKTRMPIKPKKKI